MLQFLLSVFLFSLFFSKSFSFEYMNSVVNKTQFALKNIGLIKSRKETDSISQKICQEKNSIKKLKKKQSYEKRLKKIYNNMN